MIFLWDSGRPTSRRYAPGGLTRSPAFGGFSMISQRENAKDSKS